MIRRCCPLSENIFFWRLRDDSLRQSQGLTAAIDTRCCLFVKLERVDRSGYSPNGHVESPNEQDSRNLMSLFPPRRPHPQRRWHIGFCGELFSRYAPLLVATIFLFQSASLSCAETPEYLSEPIDDKTAELYRNLLKEKLLTSPGNCGAVILMPPGHGEWAVSVSAVKQGKSESSPFRLALTSAMANLYDSKLGLDRKNIDVPIRKIRVKIDKEFALAIRRAWRSILSKEPSPQSAEEFAMVLDGFLLTFP